MGRKSKISYEIKIKVVQEYLEGNCSLRSAATKLGIHPSSIEGWIRKYKAFGEEGLLNKGYNSAYSAQVKTQAVIDYIDGNGSLSDICINYKISSTGILQQWIKKY